MGDREDFETWVRTRLTDAENALHQGDPEPRRALWSRHEPVSVLGAWKNAFGEQEVNELFDHLGGRFSDATDYALELLDFEVVGDLAYTVALEHNSVSVGSEPRTYTLRATQVYRREDGEWKVVHRHGSDQLEG